MKHCLSIRHPNSLGIFFFNFFIYIPFCIHTVVMQMWVIQWYIESPQQIAGVRKQKQRPLQPLMASPIISNSLMCILHSLFYLLPLLSLTLSFSVFINAVYREGASTENPPPLTTHIWHLSACYTCPSLRHQSAHRVKSKYILNYLLIQY